MEPGGGDRDQSLPRDPAWGVIDRRTISWTAAWARSALIVLYFVIFTVVLPSWILQTAVVSELSRALQEAVGAGVWAIGLAVGLWGLWKAQRTSRI